jgi:hypothetical protein
MSMRKVYISFLLLSLPIFTPLLYSIEKTGTISGQVVDQSTHLPLPQCNISVDSTDKGTTTDSLGLFILKLPYGLYLLEFSYIGYESVKKTVELNDSIPNQRLRIALTPHIFRTDEIVVTGQPDKVAPDVHVMVRSDLKIMPTVHSDILRGVKILPGVTSNNELSSAYNVRGGNYDENLIYLNGYEIYRPYLIRGGVEENQSLINPDMTHSLQFYSGGYPARFGDKMSSVLEVDYLRQNTGGWHGVARGNLLNSGFTLFYGSANFNGSIGLRYSNPTRFFKKLQTSGDYHPRFSDLQLYLNYQLTKNRNLEIFLLYADNQFDLTPDIWRGNFKEGMYDVKGIDIEYNGYHRYIFQTGLLGARYQHKFNPSTEWSLALAGFLSGENEQRDLEGNTYYIPDSRYPARDREYLKTRIEKSDNHLRLYKYDLRTDFSIKKANHFIQAGGGVKLNQLDNSINEFFEEIGEENLLEPSRMDTQSWQKTLHQLEVYLQDQFTPFTGIQLNTGIRYLFFQHTREHLYSPRISVHLYPFPKHILYFRWGYYYQPPYYYELKSLSNVSAADLKSQRAINYIAGWKSQLKEKLNLQVECYYKQLDRLLPFYFEDLQIIYSGVNENKGYARGLDLLIKGELIEGLNSWLGYSYLDTKESSHLSDGISQRRLLDQTHTFRLFLQDKIPFYPNIQYHNRILFGSGFLYHPRTVEVNPENGKSYLVIHFGKRYSYPFYARVDMGLSVRIQIGRKYELLFISEVLNIFNNYNVVGYSWFQVFSQIQKAIPIPRILTKRFFNFGIELYF